MTNYKAGETIVLEHEDGSRLVREVLDPGALYVLTVQGESARIEELLKHGWRVTDHKPKTELPTEPGVYLVDDHDAPSGFDVIHRIGDGRWVNHDDGYYLDDAKLATYAKFTYLVPEGSEREAAIRDVLEWQKAKSGTRAAEALITETLHRFVSSE